MKPAVDRLVFMAASGFSSDADRKAFLDHACKGDDSLRELVEELLEVKRDADDFFELEPEVAPPPPRPGTLRMKATALASGHTG